MRISKDTRKAFSQSMAEFRPDELFFNLLPDEEIEEGEDDEKAENARKALAKSILRFVRHSSIL
ncbi:hypothetical protein EEK90_07050 [Muribaculaceae bacterium Isolate-036 (Harlan)]|nr:hypothetical protein EEK90_07050 [Muribaculaceae bacterium Isolate-036 (Harlan)]